MNNDLLGSLSKRNRAKNPPGCHWSVVSHPIDERRAVEIGFMVEHRFAFFYWLRDKAKKLKQHRIEEHQYRPPDLITWDWHDDVGGACDWIEEDIRSLNIHDEQELAFFCWSALMPNNDGHIAPAAWLNAIGNVYVLQKQRSTEEIGDFNCDIEDMNGQTHSVRYFRNPKSLWKEFEETNSRSNVYWDLDMDFFTSAEESDDRTYSEPMSRRSIQSLLKPDRPWIPRMLSELELVTIALEPTYTGGMSRSLEIYKTWEDMFFTAPVDSDGCSWREGVL